MVHWDIELVGTIIVHTDFKGDRMAIGNIGYYILKILFWYKYFSSVIIVLISFHVKIYHNTFLGTEIGTGFDNRDGCTYFLR